jgi:DNA-directed RNA polymerase II subunit RPB7
MFFEITQQKNIRLHPRNFGAKLRDELLRTLMKEVAGTCTQRFGYVIAVIDVRHCGKGLLQEGTGHAVFPVTYTCIVMRPFKGEVFEAVVTNVTRMGIYAEIGPMVRPLPVASFTTSNSILYVCPRTSPRTRPDLPLPMDVCNRSCWSRASRCRPQSPSMTRLGSLSIATTIALSPTGQRWGRLMHMAGADSWGQACRTSAPCGLTHGCLAGVIGRYG